MAMSHVGHDHPATPAGRRACRSSVTPNWITAAVANSKRIDRVLGRVQPARSAEAYRNSLKADPSPCIQADLHIDAHGGRCACGWVAS